MTLLAAVDHAQADFNTMNSYLLATFTSHNFDLVVLIDPPPLPFSPSPTSSNVLHRLLHGRTPSLPGLRLHSGRF